MKSIEDNVTAFRRWLVSDERKTSMYAKMLEQLDKYWVQLFADPCLLPGFFTLPVCIFLEN